MKRMYISVPGATQKEMNEMKKILQVVFDSEMEEDYLVLIGKNLDIVDVDTKVFDKLKEIKPKNK